MVVTPKFSLDAANIQEITANPNGDAVPPTINFAVTAPEMAGGAFLDITLKDGSLSENGQSFSPRVDGEREIRVRLPVTWMANKEEAEFTVPEGNLTVQYVTADGAALVSKQINNAQANLFTLVKEEQEVQLQLAITKLFKFIPELEDGVNVNGDYAFQVILNAFQMADAEGTKVTKVIGEFKVE